VSGGVVGLVLAAGGSTRMGRPKQLAELAGRPMLEHVAATLAAAPLDRVLVALGAHAERVLAGVDLHGAEVYIAESWREGMGRVLADAASVLAGRCDALVVVLGDQPLLTPATIERLVTAWRSGSGPVVRAAYGGRAGHPVLFSGPALEELLALRADEGARELLRRRPDWVKVIELGHTGDDMDVDDEAGLDRARALLRDREVTRGGVVTAELDGR
jgi:molybdenum cofactor cytidylyltransferase